MVKDNKSGQVLILTMAMSFKMLVTTPIKTSIWRQPFCLVQTHTINREKNIFLPDLTIQLMNLT